MAKLSYYITYICTWDYDNRCNYNTLGFVNNKFTIFYLNIRTPCHNCTWLLTNWVQYLKRQVMKAISVHHKQCDPGLHWLESIIGVRNQILIFLFLIQNICCGCSKQPFQRDGSFEHPKQMFKLTDKKILILFTQFLFICPNILAKYGNPRSAHQHCRR